MPGLPDRPDSAKADGHPNEEQEGQPTTPT
jgi:hypothetical protein